MFRSLSVSLLLLLFFFSIACAAPNLINFQGVLTDSAGVPVTNISQAVTFRLYDAETVGTLLWEGVRTVNVENGSYHVLLGSVTSLDSTLLSGDSVWLEIEVSGEILSARQRLTSVPYALQAARATSAATADNAATQVDFAAHTGNPSAHHSRYTNTEAVSAVANSNLSPYGACTGADQAMQWSGSQWVCVNLKQLSPSGGHAKGFELTDSWGEIWDGVPRNAAGWAEADAACTAAGGRLPTVAELYRNNGASGSGSLSGILDANNLWTQIADETPGNRLQVSLAAGTIISTPEATKSSYRCVWPAQTSAGFSGAACYGSAGAECQAKDQFWNVDSQSRPAMSYAAAANECRAVDAAPLSVQDFQELAQAGLSAAASGWMWASDSLYWYNGGFGNARVRSQYQASQLNWHFSSYYGYGSLAATTSKFSVRCIGRNPAFTGTAIPSNPGCQNGICFNLSQGQTRLVADNQDRVPASYTNAVATCRSLGGSLPDDGEFGDLVRSGWGNGSNAWLWSADPVYWYNGGYGVSLFRFTGTGTADWSNTSASMERSQTSTGTLRNYRCVWHEKIEPAMISCAQNQRTVWNGSGYNCQPAADGDSGGNANVVQKMDAWGNAWDGAVRTKNTFTAANAACQAIGGRLPTATEIYRVRWNQGLVPSLGDTFDTEYLWTQNPHPEPLPLSMQHTLVRLSDGLTANAKEDALLTYRCLWPKQAGDVFDTAACYGAPTAACFEKGDLRIDRYDRAPVSQTSAAWECTNASGHLPTMNELQQLIHGGAPNGSGAKLWSVEPAYWYNNNYGYAMFSWTGTGTSSWIPDSTTFGLAEYTATTPTIAPFRCVYSNTLK